MRKKLPLLIVLMMVLSACAAQATGLEGTWKLAEYGPVGATIPAMADVDASFTFDGDGMVSGTSGCNSMGGEYEVNGNEITFGPLTSTLMGCEEPLMTQESFVTQVLSDTAQYEVNGNTLTITNGDNVLVFSK